MKISDNIKYLVSTLLHPIFNNLGLASACLTKARLCNSKLYFTTFHLIGKQWIARPLSIELSREVWRTYDQPSHQRPHDSFQHVPDLWKFTWRTLHFSPRISLFKLPAYKMQTSYSACWSWWSVVNYIRWVSKIFPSLIGVRSCKSIPGFIKRCKNGLAEWETKAGKTERTLESNS